VIGAERKTNAKKELFEIERKEFKLPELYHGRFDDAFDEMEILDFPLCSPFELVKEFAVSSKQFGADHRPLTMDDGKNCK